MNVAIHRPQDIEGITHLLHNKTPVTIICVDCLCILIELRQSQLTENGEGDPAVGCREADMGSWADDLGRVPVVLVCQSDFDLFHSVVQDVAVVLLAHCCVRTIRYCKK